MTESQGQPAVEIRDLGFRWPGQVAEALAVDALTIARGERVFIEGPSGSGKSTLLGLLAGVAVPQRGTLRVLGQAMWGLGQVARDRLRADHIGYIFQMFNLIPYLSVVENVSLPCRFSRLRRRRALEQSPSVPEEALRLLAHLDLADPPLLARAASLLSVGQQQRVAAARALMGAPELLIADEPTSALDSDRREAFVRLLFKDCEELGSTLVFVSHDASLEALFDRTLRLTEINRAYSSASARGPLRLSGVGVCRS